MIHLKTFEAHSSDKKIILKEYADKYLIPSLRDYFHCVIALDKFIITEIGGVSTSDISRVHLSDTLVNNLNKTGIFEKLNTLADSFEFESVKKIEQEPDHHIGEYAMFLMSYDSDERQIVCQFENSGEITVIENLNDLYNFIHVG